MPYDPEAMFRVGEEELQLTEEGQIQAELLRQAEEERKALAAQQAAGQSPQPAVPTPTGGQEQAQQPVPSTEAQDPFDPTKDYSYYEALGMSRQEWNKRRLGGLEVGSEVEDFAKDPKYAAELVAAIPTGPLDFGVDLINIIPGINLPKLTKFENDTAQAIRELSSVILPTFAGVGAAKGLGAAAHARVGWNFGNTPFMRWLGNRGAEAVGGLAVGAVSNQYEGENLLGKAKKVIPSQWDFIPDDIATLDGDQPDDMRRKNIY